MAMRVSLNSSVEVTCPWLARRWDREQRGTHPSDDNVCYLWEEMGVPPDVVQYCAGTLPWHGERFVPVQVETQWSICLTHHYGSCRWLREREWHSRETTVACPLLGAKDDRQRKYLYPSVLNICHGRKSTPVVGQTNRRRVLGLLNIRKVLARRRKGGEAAVAAEQQKEICLTKRWTACEIYLRSRSGS